MDQSTNSSKDYDHSSFGIGLPLLLLFIICIQIEACKSKNVDGGKEEIPDHPRISLDQEPSKVIYKGKYTLETKTKTGFIPVKCNGDGITIEFYDDLKTLKINGFTNCGLLVGKMDIGQYLNTESYKDMEELNKDLKYKGIIIRVQNPKKVNGLVPEGTVYFTPPKPNIVNPLARENILNSYVGQSLTEKTQAVLGTSKGNISDSGDISVKIHGVYKSVEGLDTSCAPLKEGGRIIEFLIDSPGFNNIPQKGNYLLFNHMKFWMGTSPVAVYKFEIDSKLRDVISKEDLLKQVKEKKTTPLLKALKIGGDTLLQTLFPNTSGVIDSIGGLINIEKTVQKAIDNDIHIKATLNEHVHM